MDSYNDLWCDCDWYKIFGLQPSIVQTILVNEDHTVSLLISRLHVTMVKTRNNLIPFIYIDSVSGGSGDGE